VDAEIQDTGYDDTETMMIVPSASIISWLRESPIPGNDGNAILGGHNRWKGARGQLLYLDELSIGDDMEIDYDDGSTLTFRLESVFVYPLATADADSIMELEGEARVTVITCKDPFNTVTGTSDNRIIAVFKEESVFVVPDPPVEPWPPVYPEDEEAPEHELPEYDT
jgi:LPXTG-site transpeptidase (sortase) family protein